MVGDSFVDLGPRAEGELAKPDFFQHGMSLNAGKGDHTGQSGPGTVRARLSRPEFSTAPPPALYGRRRAARGRICSADGPETSSILGSQQAQKTSGQLFEFSGAAGQSWRIIAMDTEHAGASTLRWSCLRAQISSRHAGLPAVHPRSSWPKRYLCTAVNVTVGHRMRTAATSSHSRAIATQQAICRR